MPCGPQKRKGTSRMGGFLLELGLGHWDLGVEVLNNAKELLLGDRAFEFEGWGENTVLCRKEFVMEVDGLDPFKPMKLELVGFLYEFIHNHLLQGRLLAGLRQ